MIGRQIGNYLVTSEIAQGGMGAVYRGRHQNLPREVVVKAILLSSFPPASRDHLKARFVREAYVQSQLDHPNIVRVYEFFAAEENYYLVMEFVDGMTLRDLVSRRGALPVDHAVSLLRQSLAALTYAHNFDYVDEAGNKLSGVIHRDIKPANLLIDGIGRLKLTDFGIVKLAGESGMTRTGFNPGTAEYMSPEQIRGEIVDARSDIYSLGITFYEALSGRLPFSATESGSEYGVMRGHTELAPRPLGELQPDLPVRITSLVMRALEKEPSKRFQTAAEWLNALDEPGASGAISQETEVIPRPRPTQETERLTEALSSGRSTAPPAAATNVMPSRRPVVPLVIGAIFAILILVVAGYFVWRQMSAPGSTPGGTPGPTPGPAPTPSALATPQADDRLAGARKAEEAEQYADAIKIYEDYLKANAQAPDHATLSERVTQLKALNGHLRIAETWLSQGDYAEARKDFDAALKIRPESKLAKSGLERADAGIKRK